MFFVWAEIVCRNCSTTVGGHHTMDKPRRTYMKAEAKEHSWVREGDEWFCGENCLTAHHKLEAAE